MGVTFNPFTGELMPSSSGGGTDANAFAIFQPITGTSPTASTTSDTINFASSDSSIGVAGNSGTKTMDLSVGNHSAAKITTGTLLEARGGTNQSTYATGDTLYASAANTLSKLAIGSSGQIKKVLSTGIPGYRDIIDISAQDYFYMPFGGWGNSAGVPSGFTSATSGATGSPSVGSVNVPGSNGIAGAFVSGVVVYAGANATSWAAITGDVRNSLFPLAIGAVTFETVIKILNLSKSTDRFITTVGLCPSGTTTAAPTDGIYFTQVDNVNSGKWQFNCANASTVTSVDTGIAGSTSITRLGFTTNAAGTSIQAVINGANAGTAITTNIPATTTGLAFYWQARNTVFASQIAEFVIANVKFLVNYTTAR